MTTRNLKQAIAATLTVATLASYGALANAQSYDPDPWGWGAQSTAQQNEAGRQAACRSYINEYNTIVDFYNNERDPGRKKQWLERIQSIRENARPYGCGL